MLDVTGVRALGVVLPDDVVPEVVVPGVVLDAAVPVAPAAGAALLTSFIVLSVSVFDKTPVTTLFSDARPQNESEDMQKHLCLWA